jgi:ferrochelatase
MAHYKGESGFRHDAPPCTGVLLVNLGTPEAPTAQAVRRYLGEFLWDPRVVEIPRPLWWLILHGIILRLRPGKVAKAYQSVWTHEGSPLMVFSMKQAAALRQRLSGPGSGRIETALAMRYGKPSIEQALNELKQQGMRRLLVLPMYPQYSATTTATVFDEVARVLSGWRWIPEFRFIQNYHDDPGYIGSLAASVLEHWQQNGRPERLLMSFHGLPKRCLLSGDPYYCECSKTARLLAEKLQLRDDEWQLTFQSRFGREEWLQPYTDVTLREWAQQGTRHVDVICPGFSADCLETLEEIAEQNRGFFLENGGQKFSYIPALNDRADHVEALAGLVNRHIQGWEFATHTQQELEASRSRAQAAGATD